MSLPDRLNAALEGRYTIERELGEGGMATVYLATDVKHDRQVALKVLKEDLAAVVGEERFLDEIRTTAKLQHPNILPLFDSGAADGFLFYAMPYVQGETLREKLRREVQLPVEDAIEAVQKIAGALDYAHEQGIVHRDIKPSNVLLSSGEPLIADFGIAIAVSQANDGRRTETGLSLGTPHYMSPEQAAGDRSLDPRSDIYALGCVLQELLTGEPPFSGANAQAVLARILTTRPTPVTSLRPTVPPHIESAIGKALEKLPADRFKTARDFRKALGDVDFRHTVVERTLGSTAVPTQTRIVRQGIMPPVAAGIGAAALLVGAVAGAALLGGSGDESSTGPVSRASVTLPADFEWSASGVVRVSPDDEHLVSVDPSGIWIRGIADAEFRLLPDTEAVTDVTFSLDGRELVALDGDDIVRLALDGSNRRLVVRDEDARTVPRWGDDGFGYFLRQGTAGFAIARVPMSGTGQVEPVAPEIGIPMMYSSVDPLPGGRTLLASAVNLGTDVRSTVLVDTETGEVSPPVLEDGGDARWVDTGHIVFVDSRGDLRATPFDPSTGETTGQIVQFDRRVSSANPAITRVSVSRRGTLVYSEGEAFSMLGALGGATELVVITFAGDTTRILNEGVVAAPSWSPDGRYLSYGSGSSLVDLQVSVYDTELTVPPRAVATDVPYSIAGFWSPDGESLLVMGGTDLQTSRPRLAEAFGVRSEEVAEAPDAGGGVWVVPAQWSEHGILYLVPAGEEAGIWYQPELTAPAELWLPGDASEASVSPQGDFLAYTSAGEGGLMVRAFPEIGPRIEVAPRGGGPRWSPDGDAIYYSVVEDGVTLLRRIDVTREPTFAVLSDERVLELSSTVTQGWDLHPDGDRVAVAMEVAMEAGEGLEEADPNADGVTPDHTWIVFNWFERIREAFAEEDGR
jgi:serine/threonine-protein kinase